jgi:hypothetical protein
MSVRLYAVLRLRRRAPSSLPQGLHGERLRLVKGAGYSLVVADTPESAEPVAENLLEFDRVIRGLASISAAILPAQFGAMSQTVEALRAEIGDRAEAFSAALDQVTGRVQMNIRIPAGPKEPVVRVGKGADYLRTRAAASNFPALVKMREALQALVCEERIESGPEGATVYHLIEAGDAGAYLDRAAGFRPSGPFPPYAFVPGIAGIDRAIWPGYDEKRKKPAAIRSARPRARRRSAGNTDR